MDILLELIIIIFALILTIFAFQRYRKSTPAFLFTIVWTVQIFFVILGWSNYFYFRYYGLIFILFCVFCYDLGYQVVVKKSFFQSEAKKYQVIYNSRHCVLAYFFVLIIAIATVAYSIYSRGSILDLNSFIEMSNQSSIERYSGEESGGILNKLLGVNSYTCPLVGGLMFYFFKQKKKRYLSYLAIFPSVLEGLSQGAKMGIISGFFLWVIGYIVSSKILSVKINIKLKNIVLLGIGFVAFMLLLVLTMMFRYGSFDIETFYSASGTMISYGLGHLPAFDMWYVDHVEDLSEFTFGGKTLYGLTNSLGILSREQGVFTKMYQVSPYGDETNVFTAFRFFVEDFGTIGSFIYMFLIGSLCRYIYDNFCRLNHLYLNVTLMCAIYFYISWSFATSAFAYASYILMFFYLYFLLKFMFVRTQISE